VTANGQLEAFDAGKQRSALPAFERFSSDTTAAAKDIWKGRQGLQEYEVKFLVMTRCSLKAANCGKAHCIIVPEKCENIQKPSLIYRTVEVVGLSVL
jgi:hypothetical protein